MWREGKPVCEIHAEVGGRWESIDAMCDRFRAEREACEALAARRMAYKLATTFGLNSSARNYYLAHAGRRGCSAHALKRAILETVAKDDMLKAILDD